jgi:thioredoxin-like negative regulator of GroEL
MAIHDLSTESDLASILEGADTLLIDFWSPACPPCKAFAPVFESAAERHSEVAFCKVNTREEEDLSGAFGVEHIPTLVAIRERVVVASQPGYLTGDQIDELLRLVGDLDMDAIQETASGEAETDTV